MPGIINPFPFVPGGGFGGGGGGGGITAPTWVGASTEQSTTGPGGSITPSIPPGVAANDILLLIVATNSETVSAPGGWTAVANSPVTTGSTGSDSGIRTTVFWRRATGSDSAPTVSGPSEYIYGLIAAVRGCPTSGDPWDVTSGTADSSASATSVLASATTSTANCFVVLIDSSAIHTSLSKSCAVTNSNLSSLTDRFVGNDDFGYGAAMALTTGVLASAGAIGSTTFVWSSGSSCNKVDAMFLIALKGV